MVHVLGFRVCSWDRKPNGNGCDSLQQMDRRRNVKGTRYAGGRVMGNLASVVDLPNEEAALVAELKAGNEQAFAELITRYHQPLYSLIVRSLRDPADASDITQEVFIKVFRNIRGFHGEASLRTWLYRIALHEASNQRRWWSRHKRQEIAMDAPCCSRSDADAEGEAQSLGASLADAGCSPFDYAAQDEVR